MLGQHVTIICVENGFVVDVNHAGSRITLVAKEISEVCGFIKGIEWNSPRPLDGPGTLSVSSQQKCSRLDARDDRPAPDRATSRANGGS